MCIVIHYMYITCDITALNSVTNMVHCVFDMQWINFDFLIMLYLFSYPQGLCDSFQHESLQGKWLFYCWLNAVHHHNARGWATQDIQSNYLPVHLGWLGKVQSHHRRGSKFSCAIFIVEGNWTCGLPVMLFCIRLNDNYRKNYFDCTSIVINTIHLLAINLLSGLGPG